MSSETTRLSAERLNAIQRELEYSGDAATFTADDVRDLRADRDLNAAEAAHLETQLIDARAERDHAIQVAKRMVDALHVERGRANRMERWYLDVESGAVHIELDYANELLDETRKDAAAAAQRSSDLIAELRRQLDPATRSVRELKSQRDNERKLRLTAEAERDTAQAQLAEVVRQIHAIPTLDIHPLDDPETVAGARAHNAVLADVRAALDGGEVTP